jgi:soluble P-type ATPase
VALVGDHKSRAARILKHTKIRVHKIANTQNNNIKQAILSNDSNSKLLIGIGNIKGRGYQIINEFDKAS